MIYLIDSDIIIDHHEGEPDATTILSRLPRSDVAISAVTYMEVYQGTFYAADIAASQTRLDRFLSQIKILDFTPEIARRCARIRFELQERGTRIRSRHLDLMNAATAIHHDLALVTRNIADYQDIPGLRLHA